MTNLACISRVLPGASWSDSSALSGDALACAAVVNSGADARRGGGFFGFACAFLLLGAGLCLLGAAIGATYRSSITCRREAAVLHCELERVYFGSLALTDRIELRSVAVETRRTQQRSGRRAYDILVLNDDIGVPRLANPHAVAERLRSLLARDGAPHGRIALQEPSYSVAAVLTTVGLFSIGAGAFLAWLFFVHGKSHRQL